MRFVGREVQVVDLMLAEAFFDVGGEFLLHFEVALTHGGGVEKEEVLIVLEILETGPVAEGEVDFVTVPELEGDDFVAFSAQDADSLQNGGGIVKKVADEDHKPTAFQALGERFDDRREAGVLAGRSFDHRLQQHVQMRDLRVAGNDVAHLAVEGDEPDGVLLAHEQVGEGCGELARVVELQDVFAAAVIHAATGIEHDGGAQIGLLVVFADVKAVAAAKDLPVKAADLIALHVRPVLAELDAEPLVRRRVMPRGESLHDGAREELQMLQARDVFGVEDVAQGSHWDGNAGRKVLVGRNDE